ncbi:MAG: polysaccharide biosynthesis/export family protein [Ferruginibacter sp.]|nr:polysaccharide biosynthesis/export family protein [Chitinophagaceae bacterium]MBP6285366.1 polysaccharide biosynthesis/export family protein [Ferruginibacter sp.]MBU9935036.1 polysaccharide biosynthesis/export family protein [Ferruginibacter sp.]HQY10580.1 polysaccharide biosynthesis/export family protein [Ferruginibacter sp.]
MAGRYITIFILQFLLVYTSCTPSKKVAYFQNAQDSAFRQVLGTIEAPIQKNDILNIVVSSLSPEEDVKYNRIDNTTKGYLVNNDGTIQLPKLGNVMAAGLTKKQLTDKITNIILEKKELLNPIVEIRQLNFEVTVLGEVTNPTVINVPSEKISLVKALGLAGDITIYGKRDNILLIREEDGKRMTRHLDINSADFLSSEYYYLKPNDVVYVEPNKAKIATTNRSQQVLPLIFSSISVLILVLDRVIK